MNYTCNALLFLGLFDATQMMPLLKELIKRFWSALCALCTKAKKLGEAPAPARGDGATPAAAEDEPPQPRSRGPSVGELPFADSSNDAGTAGGTPAQSAPVYDTQYLLSMYTRMVLMSSIYHVFMIVAPLSTFFAWLYFLPSYPLQAHVLLRVLGRPGVDSRGAVWEEAVHYQTIGLLVSQVLLLGVISVQSPSTAFLIVAAFTFTLVRTSQMETNALRVRRMLLQRCAQLDRADGGEPAFAGLRAYENALGSTRVTLLEGLEQGIALVVGATTNLDMTTLAQPLISSVGLTPERPTSRRETGRSVAESAAPE